MEVMDYQEVQYMVMDKIKGSMELMEPKIGWILDTKTLIVTGVDYNNNNNMLRHYNNNNNNSVLVIYLDILISNNSSYSNNLFKILVLFHYKDLLYLDNKDIPYQHNFLRKDPSSFHKDQYSHCSSSKSNHINNRYNKFHWVHKYNSNRDRD